MNFLIACGGTAGHINPALAIAAELKRVVPGARILFIGAGKELEKRLIPRAGFHVLNIRMSGLKRGVSAEKLLYNMGTVRNLATAGIKTEKLIRRFSPDAVIGTGGYICYPVLKKAAQMGIPSLVHESNAVPGLTTKLLSAYVHKVLVSFRGIEALFRKPERVIFTGTPVRAEFKELAGSAALDESARKPRVVSFWGSLGAERMNEFIADFIKLNIGRGEFDHIHATGNSEMLDVIISRLGQAGVTGALPPGIVIKEYIDDMPAVMAAADIVLCRAGGSTLAELTVLGKPAVLVPSPYVSNNEQEENAKQLEKAGGVLLLREKDCSGEVLFEAVAAILRDREKLRSMADAQSALGAPDALETIVSMILAECNM